ncbi:MAG TPA: tRNA (5-methylaminomethyl-2-thiouridine)(34)-methyltransferase MnmD [Saprospiraceae bacterium]|nr:tRNA (5-methylaminomethyl-2-thiouridine)(34)-methyltransferase MnmD [Saprospiraceae bacterium]
MPDEAKNELIETQDGSHSLLSHQFGVSYHSKYGAVQESRHVFINAGLKARMLLDDRPLRILEFGFGTGLNALLSYQMAEELGRPIHYEGMEAYPVSLDFVDQLNYPQETGMEAQFFRQLHTLEWGETHEMSQHFTFRKVNMPFEDMTYDSEFDIIFFDAFAPNAQAELWEAPLLSKAYKALRPSGYLVTYCAKGVVKRTLKAIGFRVDTLPGPPGKREMTRGAKPASPSSS